MLPGVTGVTGYFTLSEALITHSGVSLSCRGCGCDLRHLAVEGYLGPLLFSTSKQGRVEPKESNLFESTAHLPCEPCGYIGFLLTKRFLTLLTKVNNLEAKWCGAKGQRMAKELSVGLTEEALLFSESLVLSFPSPAVCCRLVALFLSQARVYM